MLISVALCTYNGETYLPDQLESIRGQTRLPDEVILCDDGSQDRTLVILRDFERAAPFPVIVHQQAHNLGSTANFADAIQRCSGDIIVLADQDDVWYPDKLATIAAVFENEPDVGLVFSNADVMDRNLQPLGYKLWQSVRFSRTQQAQMGQGGALTVLLKHPVITGATMVFRKQYRSVFLPIPSIWIHDEWIGLHLALITRLYPIPRPLMCYRRHATNQVGAEGVRWRERWQAALQTNPSVYFRRAEQYRLLLHHLAHFPSISSYARRQLNEKINHLHFRGTLPRQRLGRILPIALHLPQYVRYTNSLLNALRDLLLQHTEA